MTLDAIAVGKATTATYVENGETLCVGDRDLLRLQAFTEAYLAAVAPVPPDGENPYDERDDPIYRKVWAAGFAAGRAAATPDPHGPRCAACGFGPMPAASPDERRDAARNAIADLTPDPPDAADLVAAHLRERWPCTCRPGMDGGGVYHAADCNSRREGSQAVLAVIRLLRAADPAASPDERLREAVRDARDHAYLALQVGVPHDRIIDHLRDIWEACSAALAAADREAPDGDHINDSETEKPMTYTPENDDRWKVPLSSDPRVTNAMVLAALDASDPGWRDVGASNVWPMVRALEAVVNHRDVFLFAPDSQDRPETDT